MQYSISGPPSNPLARILAAVLGLLALVGAFFFGVFILLGAIVLGLLAWIAIRIRIWWLRRKGGGAFAGAPGGFRPQDASRGAPAGKREDVIEAEYEVVSRKED